MRNIAWMKNGKQNVEKNHETCELKIENRYCDMKFKKKFQFYYW